MVDADFLEANEFKVVGAVEQGSAPHEDNLIPHVLIGLFYRYFAGVGWIEPGSVPDNQKIISNKQLLLHLYLVTRAGKASLVLNCKVQSFFHEVVNMFCDDYSLVE